MTAKLGVLAGGGMLPVAVAEAARAQGRDVFVLAFEGQTDPAAVVGQARRPPGSANRKRSAARHPLGGAALA